jgi:hypothetical protein
MGDHLGDIPPRVGYNYQWNGFGIRALFAGRDVSDTRCVSLLFTTPNDKFTEAEIKTIMAANVGGSSWIIVRGGWIRADRQALAWFDGARCLTVFTPDFYHGIAPRGFEGVLETFRAGATTTK